MKRKRGILPRCPAPARIVRGETSIADHHMVGLDAINLESCRSRDYTVPTELDGCKGKLEGGDSCEDVKVVVLFPAVTSFSG